MQYLLFALLPLCAALAPPVLPPPPTVIESAPTVEDYKSALDTFKKKTKDVFDFAALKDLELTNKDTKETIKFDKLPDFDKHVFCLMTAERVTNELAVLTKFWDEEIAKFADPLYIPVPPVDPKQKAARLEDVEKYHKQLQDVRKAFAVKYEAFAVKTMTQFKNEVPQKEWDAYLKKMRDTHDKSKLIERK